MTEEQRHERNRAMLAQCWPVFARKIEAVIHDLEGHGLRPRIQCAWRSPADQLKAYQAGNSKLRFGFHNVTGAGGHPEALAVDILDDDQPLDPPTRYLLMLASSVQAHGLQSGIRWGLSTWRRRKIDEAIAAKQWDAPVAIGWDPCHVEVTGLTVTRAKAGARR